MGSAFHQLCPRYRGTLTPTASTAIRLWETVIDVSLKMIEEERTVIYPSLLEVCIAFHGTDCIEL